MYAKFVGIKADTAALIEMRRQAPHESEDDILRRALAPTTISTEDSNTGPAVGCDLGKGAVLHEGEKLYFFAHKSSRDAAKPEAVARAFGGNLYLYDRKVEPSKGSLVQPALRMVQERLNHRNSDGDFISLNAWDYWYVNRDSTFVKASELRDGDRIVRRGRYQVSITEQEAEEMGL